MRMRLGTTILLACCTLSLVGCYEVPVTGRRAVTLVDAKEVAKLSAASFEDLKHQYRISKDRERNEQLKRVGERLAQVVFWDMPDADWEFVVFDAPDQINAFAMAGGKVGVFSGLYKIIENDDQLASVLGHEIAHVTAKHVDERLTRELEVNTLGTIGAVGLGVGGANPLLGAAVLDAYGLTTGVAGLAFDRKKEMEADHIGLFYMARAGYDPEQAVKVLERLDEVSAGQAAPAAFLSTHPSNPERILRLQEALPKAREAQAQSGRAASAPIIVK
jgi:predicted Zn-dependent protease